jgi:iron(III) transport system permease protein
MDNRLAAAQLAALLLGVVLLLLMLERRAQARMRFVGRGERAGSQEARPVQLHGPAAAVAWVLCALPLLMGFVAPVIFMLRPLWVQDWELPWARFLSWSINSLSLGLGTAALAVGLAILLAFVQRRHPDGLTRSVVGLASLGYAVPGAVVVVGLLLPVWLLLTIWPQSSAGYWVTATVLGLVWAYLVRFSAVALQSVQSGYARIPLSLDESARMMGSSDARLLREVHWPLLKGPAAAAALLVFVDVMKELPATLVLRPFNSDTLAVVTYQLARDERLGEAALPALALVLVGLLPVMLLSRTLRDESQT